MSRKERARERFICRFSCLSDNVLPCRRLIFLFRSIIFTFSTIFLASLLDTRSCANKQSLPFFPWFFLIFFSPSLDFRTKPDRESWWDWILAKNTCSDFFCVSPLNKFRKGEKGGKRSKTRSDSCFVHLDQNSWDWNVLICQLNHETLVSFLSLRASNKRISLSTHFVTLIMHAHCATEYHFINPAHKVPLDRQWADVIRR